MQVITTRFRGAWLLVVAAFAISGYLALSSSLRVSTLITLLGVGLVTGAIVSVLDRPNAMRYGVAVLAVLIALILAKGIGATPSLAVIMVVLTTSARLLTEIMVMILRKGASERSG